MKRLSILAFGACVMAMGCSGSGGSSPSQPSSGSSGSPSASTSFTVQLSPANENPPVVNADASSSGVATITIAATKDGSGNVTSATANFQVTASAFPAGSTITMAHIHPGASGVNGGILVNTGLASGDLALTNGGGQAAKNSVNVPADVAQAILSNPAGYYFNVHTTLNPNGAIRGQLGAGTSTGGGGGTNDPGPGY